MVLSSFAVTLGNEEGSLGTKNGTFSRQTTNGPVQLANSAVQIRSGWCNSGHAIKCSYSENQSSLESEHGSTTSQTSESSDRQETHVYTPSSLRCFYAARLHLVCLAVLVRIMLIVNCGFVFGEVRYVYVIVLDSNSMRLVHA